MSAEHYPPQPGTEAELAGGEQPIEFQQSQTGFGQGGYGLVPYGGVETDGGGGGDGGGGARRLALLGLGLAAAWAFS